MNTYIHDCFILSYLEFIRNNKKKKWFVLLTKICLGLSRSRKVAEQVSERKCLKSLTTKIIKRQKGGGNKNKLLKCLNKVMDEIQSRRRMLFWRQNSKIIQNGAGFWVFLSDLGMVDVSWGKLPPETRILWRIEDN